MRFTDLERYFVSEASVYRLLKAHDLITSPAFIVVKAADEFHTKTTAPNQLWQTDFTYLQVIGCTSRRITDTVIAGWPAGPAIRGMSAQRVAQVTAASPAPPADLRHGPCIVRAWPTKPARDCC